MPKNTKWGIITFSCVMIPILLYFLFLFLITDMSSAENWKFYTEFIYRIGFFFLTSIVSLTIFGSSFKTKLASATAFHQKNFYFMAIGITGSLLMVVTVFIANIDDIFDIMKLYVSFSKFVFIIVLIMFCLILYDFLCSFWINFTLNRNLKGIKTYGLIEKAQNMKNEFGTLNLTNKNTDKLIEYVEMYVQNLVFLLNTKNTKILNHYIDEWNGALSLIYTMIFHANSNLSEKKLVDLFTFIMRSNNILMMESAKHPDLKDIHLKLVTNSFKVIPDLYEKHIANAYKYEKSYNLLSEVYFKELCDSIIKLRRTNNNDIYKQMANTELKFLYHHSLGSNGAARKFFCGNYSKKKYLEDFFISLIFELIEDDRAEELPTVFSMLLSIPEHYKEENIKARLSANKQDNIKQHTTTGKQKLLSEDVLRGCLYAIVKANEIENYRAAGYLIKVVTDNASIDLLKKQINNVHREIKRKNSFSLNTSNININNFSLEYCFKKTYLLFNLQFKLKKIEILNYKVIKDDEKTYLIAKLAERKKEYNLVALQEEYIDDFKEVFV
ncbi:hypothetical protein [Sporosarcina psychrophila]|uniref:Phage abortive infection protein n=1 Tax=Sporosarcina psychrophila TaxID=1476 RepID=A0ABV2K9R8_SPOPS